MSEPAVLSTYTIFFNPADFPGWFVVRRFDVVQGQKEPVPRQHATVHPTLETARDAIPPSADTCFPRATGDDPAIVETWM